MNHSILLLLSVILIAGISAPAYAQTVSEHVVINEVEINPSGDNTSINEWVELYNPTDTEVDIGGWQIASTTVLKKTLVIPAGVVISPGEFLTFTHEKLWFNDVSELIELRDSSGIIIDATPQLTDMESNFLSWQRLYDGVESNDWKFVLSTTGGTNGKIIEEEQSSSVVLTVTSDKTSYAFDTTATIQGSVSEEIFTLQPYFQTEPITINISGPNFYKVISLYPDYNLNYETNVILAKVLGVNAGTYDVLVTYGDVTANTLFSVGEENMEVSIESSSSSFDISTDKSEYVPGEFISIMGSTNEIIPYAGMKFSITDSNGKLIDNGNLFTSTGEFTTKIFLNTINPNYGEYTITAEYSDHAASVVFNVINNADDDLTSQIVPDSLILETNESEYLINDYLIMSGKIANFDSGVSKAYYQVIYFTFKDSNGNSPSSMGAIMDNSDGAKSVDYTLTAIPDASGNFLIEVRLAPVLFSEGNYVLKANYGGLIDFADISIVSEKSISDEISNIDENLVEVFNPKTILEKVNRISDNLISIDTQEKVIENQSVKPRVLSGSMITPDKNNQSTVNLQVLSESGICIIGENSDCLVNESTRKPGQIFEVVQVDGMNLNVRYSGPDVRLEKFSILPQSSNEFLPETNWNIEVIKDNEVSRFYYKVTYKTIP